MADFLAGSCGGASFLLVCHPFDTVKVRQQAALQLDGHRPGTIETVKKMWNAEGPRAFYRGIWAPLFGFGISRAAQFGAYGQALEYCVRMNEEKQRKEREKMIRAARELERRKREQSQWAMLSYQVGRALGVHEPTEEEILQLNHDDLSGVMSNQAGLPISNNIACAAFGGIAFSFVSTPFEVVRIRMQTEPIYEHREYRSTLDCARQVWRCGGIPKVWQGLCVTLLRDIPASIIYFGCYGTLRSILPSNEQGAPETSSALLAGGLSGVAQWSVIIPIDTVKTTVQTAKLGRYRGAIDAAGDIFRKHGTGGFFQGMCPAVVRAFLANAALFMGFETAMASVHAMKAAREGAERCPITGNKL